MKKAIVIIGVLLALFVSCGSSPAPASSGESLGGNDRRVAVGSNQADQIPVEVKEIVTSGNGNVSEYVTFEYDPSYSKLISQGRYSASNAMLEQIHFTYAEDKGYLTTKVTRDVENKVRNSVVYQYDNQGQLKAEALTNKNNKAVSSYEYSYDEKGNRVSKVMNSGLNQRMAETYYTYNAQGKIITSETRDAAGVKVISSIKNTYDANGNLVKQEVFNGSGQVTSIVNIVWQNGLEMKNEQTGSDGKVMLRITNEYGSYKELLKRTIEDFQGESKQVTQYEYVLKPAR